MMVNAVWFSLLLCLVTAQYDQTSFIFQDGTEFTLTASNDPVVVPDCPCTAEPGCCQVVKNPSQTVDEPDSVDQDPDGWWASTRCLIYSKHQQNLTLCTSCPVFTFLYYGDCSIDSFHVKATCSLFSEPIVTVYFDSMTLDIPNMGETIHLKFCKKSESTTQKVDSTAKETFTNPIGRAHIADSPPDHVYTSTTTSTIPTVISISEPGVSKTDSPHETQPTTSPRLNPSTRPDLSTTTTKNVDIPVMEETTHLYKKSESTTQKVDSTARETFTNHIGRDHTGDSPPDHVYTSTTTSTTPTAISTSEAHSEVSKTDSPHETQPTTSPRLNLSTRPDLSTTTTKSVDIPVMEETTHLYKKSESTTQKVDSAARETFTNHIGRAHTGDSPPDHVYTSTTTSTTPTAISTSEPDVSKTDSPHGEQPTTIPRLSPSTRPDPSTTTTPRPRQSSTNQQHFASTEPNHSTYGETNHTLFKAETNPNQSSGDDVQIPLIIGLVMGIILIIAVTAVIIAVVRRKKERQRAENRAIHTGSAFNGPYCVMGVNIIYCDRFGEVGGADPPPDYFQTVQSSGAQHKCSNTRNNW